MISRYTAKEGGDRNQMDIARAQKGSYRGTPGVAGLKGKKLSRRWTRYKRAWYYAIKSQGWRRSFQLDLGKERRRSVLRFPLRRILYSPRCMTLLNTLVMICSSGFNVSPSWNRKQLSLCIRLGSDTLYTARNTITTTATSTMCPSSFSLCPAPFSPPWYVFHRFPMKRGCSVGAKCTA